MAPAGMRSRLPPVGRSAREHMSSPRLLTRRIFCKASLTTTALLGSCRTFETTSEEIADMFIPPLMTLLRPVDAGEFYSSKVLNSDWNMTQSPSAIYVASTNKTIVSWCAVGRAGDKASQVAEFNHTTNTWSRRYNAGNYTLADDDHGHPAI